LFNRLLKPFTRQFLMLILIFYIAESLGDLTAVCCVISGGLTVFIAYLV
jgi:hypothetical protein